MLPSPCVNARKLFMKAELTTNLKRRFFQLNQRSYYQTGVSFHHYFIIFNFFSLLFIYFYFQTVEHRPLRATLARYSLLDTVRITEDGRRAGNLWGIHRRGLTRV